MPLLKFVLSELFVTWLLVYSPAGTVNKVAVETGIPKLGVPSVLNVNFCIRGLRVLPQPLLFIGWLFA
jgi:hypothetical protein